MNKNLKAIGIDLGGTKINVGLVNQEGKVEKNKLVDTDVSGGYNAILNQIIELIKELTSEVNDKVVCIGVGVPGQVDRNGAIQFAPNLSWENVLLKDDLNNFFELPIFIVNDVRAIAWGEWLYGAGKDISDFICMFVGTGIGGGIVCNGLMVEGCSNTFGEIGHMVVDIHGPSCSCGNRGCLEALASGWAIAKKAQEAILSYGEAGRALMQLAEGDITKVTAKTVVQGAAIKDPLSELIIEQVKQTLIAACVGLVNIFNPCKIVLGGGFIEGLPGIIPYIEIHVKQRALKSAVNVVSIVPSDLKANAGIIGASAYAFYHLDGCEART